MMKQISKLCSYLMMVSLVASGLAALALLVRDDPPAWMAPLAEHATQVIISALAVAFAAASFASLQATSDFVRALRAGREHRLALVVSAAYAVSCIVIEVVVGKAGLIALDIEVPDAYLVAGCTFFALAPRMRALIDVTMAAIDREEAKIHDKDEKAHELERLKIIERSRSESIANGVRNLEAERAARKRTASVGLIGAAAMLAGVGADTTAQATMTYPVESTADNIQTQTEMDIEPWTLDAGSIQAYEAMDIQADEASAANIQQPWARGPRASNQEKFSLALDIAVRNPDINAHRLAKQVDIDAKTAKVWLGWIRTLAYPQNANLLEIA